MIKKTIHFNNETLKELDELIKMLGIEGYGDIPKALKFSVTFTIQALKNESKVLPSLNESDMDFYLSSIKKLYIKNKKLDEANKILKSDEK